MEGSFNRAVFLDVTLCSFVDDTNVSEEHTSSTLGWKGSNSSLL
jgi:hypothetical protein